jgi:hypothetical protein
MPEGAVPPPARQPPQPSAPLVASLTEPDRPDPRAVGKAAATSGQQLSSGEGGNAARAARAVERARPGAASDPVLDDGAAGIIPQQVLLMRDVHSNRMRATRLPRRGGHGGNFSTPQARAARGLAPKAALSTNACLYPVSAGHRSGDRRRRVRRGRTSRPGRRCRRRCKAGRGGAGGQAPRQAPAAARQAGAGREEGRGSRRRPGGRGGAASGLQCAAAALWRASHGAAQGGPSSVWHPYPWADRRVPRYALRTALWSTDLWAFALHFEPPFGGPRACPGVG